MIIDATGYDEGVPKASECSPPADAMTEAKLLMERLAKGR
jgi:hypothetical protein